MRGLFNASFEITTLTAAKTLAYLTAPADRPIKIVKIEIENATNETNEQIAVSLKLVDALGTPTGATLTPQKTSSLDQSSGVAGKSDITANEPTFLQTYARWGYGTLYGLHKDLKDSPIEIQPTKTVALTLDAGCNSHTMRGNIWFEEVG